MVGLPDELTSQRRWVCWRWDVDEKGKPTKVPTNAHGAHARANASSTNPATWTTYEHAKAKAREWGLPGVGIVFTDSDLVGVDLDHARNADTGETEQWALNVIRYLDSYTELSQSGTGYHIIARGTLPPGGRKRGPVEMYDANSPRYFCTTGAHVDGTPETVNERTGELAAVHARYFPPKEAKPGATIRRTESASLPDDAELLTLARNAKNGAKFARLYDSGDTAGYPSQSEADLALCSLLAFYAGPDPARIDGLYRASALYRDKWDEQRGENAFGEMTIAKALDGRGPGDFYAPGQTDTPREPDWLGSAPWPGDEPALTSAQGAPTRRHLTDLGNAERLIDRFGADLHYCEPLGGWLVWDGKRWMPNAVGQVQRMAHQTARNLYAEAGALQDPDERARMAKHAVATESAARQRAMLDLAWALDGVAVLPEVWDADPWLLNVNNGTINLLTGELRPHRREDMLTKLAPVDYDADARADAWEAHLAYFLPDADLRRQLQRQLGVALVGETLEETLDIWHGLGANGKSTTSQAVLRTLGDYALAAAPNLLVQARHENHPTEVADLRGARVVFSIEIGEGRRLDEAKVKNLTGGDSIKARLMRQDFFTFQQTFSIALLCNHLPTITGTDEGIWRRIRLVPWTVQVTPAMRRPQSEVLASLMAEAPGILRWMLEGLADWQRDHGWIAPAVLAATADYRSAQDRLGDFLTDCCELGAFYTVEVSTLYDAYVEWCTQNGQEAVGKVEAGKMLRGRGIAQKRTAHGGARRWVGVRLAQGPQQDRVTIGDSFSHPPITESLSREDGKSCHPLSPSEPVATELDRARLQELVDSGLDRAQAEQVLAYEAEQEPIPF